MPSLHAVLRRPVAGALALLVLLACADSTAPTPVRDPVASVALYAPTTALLVGETTTLSASPRDAAGKALVARPIAWSSSDESVVTVLAGKITAVAAGTAEVSATSEGKSGTVEIVVSRPPAPGPEPEPPVYSVSLNFVALTVPEGDARQLVATPRDANGDPIAGVTISWESSNPAVADVSASGRVRALAMGIATITASAGGERAQGAVIVTGTYAYELLFDRWMSTSVGMRPEVHRLDFNIPGMFPVRVIGISNAPPSAAVSPDGNLIAHVCGLQSSICISDRHGDFVTMLTGWGENADQPAWSPDGARIAYRRWAAGGPPGVFNNADIWVMNVDGSGKVNLTAGSPAGTSRAHPTWSPQHGDGSYRIAYAEERLANGYLTSQIRSMRDDGSDRRDVTALGEYVDVEPAWSPNGETIAFVRSGVTWNSELFVVNAAGGAERPLLAMPLGDEQRAPAWSPDGTMLAFASNHEIIGTYITYQIYTVKADGTHVVRRTSDNTEKQNPVWRKIVE